MNRILSIVSICVVMAACQYPMPPQQVSDAVNKCWKIGGHETYIHAGKYGDGPLTEVRCVVNGQEVRL